MKLKIAENLLFAPAASLVVLRGKADPSQKQAGMFVAASKSIGAGRVMSGFPLSELPSERQSNFLMLRLQLRSTSTSSCKGLPDQPAIQNIFLVPYSVAREHHATGCISQP
jgi:hypothetical protein